MNLIYTDKNRIDIGILNAISTDFAFGTSENNFQIDCDLYEPLLESGAYVYYEGTEFGGIIDEIGSNSQNHTIRYKGRTWQGILDSKIIEPPTYSAYRVLNGNANEVLQEIIELCDLTSLFAAVNVLSEFTVNNYQVPRYMGAYQVINHMLNSVGARLKLSYTVDKVMLEAVTLVDYSKDSEWNTSQIKMYIEKNYKPVNHYVCLGTGELTNRHIIHLFTDGNGGLQPYATVAEPYKDSQYILDKRNQVLFGTDEIAKVYEYTQAQNIDTYEPLTSKPNNWERTYYNYYEQSELNEESSYANIPREYGETYNVLTAIPDDWSTNISRYYYKDGNTYKNASDLTVKTPRYPIVTTKPKDWDTKYSNYYYYWSDGVKEEYRTIPAVSYYTYKKQTVKPSDWSNNKGNYFIKRKNKVYVYEFKRRQNGTWKKYTKEFTHKIKEYTEADATCRLIESYIASTEYISISTLIKNKEAKESDFTNWKKSTYQPFYTQYTEKKAPKFTDYTVRSKKIDTVSPDFNSRTFCNKEDSEIIPVFASGIYFNKVTDHFKDLVENALDNLADEWNTDEIDVKFNADETEYFVGDIIGATDLVMNMNVTSRITKKILRVNRNKVTYQYTINRR